MSIDLHMHSVYSDGALTPDELVIYAKEKRLSAISLTDHDTIAGLKDARKQAELACIQFVDGVECIHPSHSKAYAEKVMSWAKANGLLMTGGSDFHKRNTDAAVLGSGGDGMLIPQSFYDTLARSKMVD